MESSDAVAVIQKQTSIFHWEDVCYDITIKGQPRRILDDVDGWVEPGKLTALMGASGAGKTTLLDTLASRVTMGVVTGSMFVDGKPRDQSFQRKTGAVSDAFTMTSGKISIVSRILIGNLRSNVRWTNERRYLHNILDAPNLTSVAPVTITATDKPSQSNGMDGDRESNRIGEGESEMAFPGPSETSVEAGQSYRQSVRSRDTQQFFG
ncbi:Multidrug resistance protein [Marasmius sp. AFHP31]|nr:Multidrug resistance protein [Marasmius sp. AFHP31]